MASKKKKKSKKKAVKKATKRPVKKVGKKTAKKGEPRACGECGQLGHNKRSHDLGGKLAG